MLVDVTSSMSSSCCSSSSSTQISTETTTGTRCCADELIGSCCSLTSRLRLKWVSKTDEEEIEKIVDQLFETKEISILT